MIVVMLIIIIELEVVVLLSVWDLLLILEELKLEIVFMLLVIEELGLEILEEKMVKLDGDGDGIEELEFREMCKMMRKEKYGEGGGIVNI